MLTIDLLNGSLFTIEKQHASLIKPAIAFSEEIYIKQKIGRRIVKRKKTVTNFAWAHRTKTHVVIWRGFLRGVIALLNQNSIEYEIIGKGTALPSSPPFLQNITFRNDQLLLIEKALKYKRGVIKAPTGSGKSIVIGGILTSYKTARCLIITHLSDLVIQLKKDFETLTNEPVTQLTTRTQSSPDRINVVTIQSLSRFSPVNYSHKYDVIIIDECLAKGTLITTTTGLKPIEQIKKGEKVITQKGEQRITATFTNKIPLTNLCKITLSNGKVIFSSTKHLFKLKDKWVEAQNLKQNDILTSD